MFKENLRSGVKRQPMYFNFLASAMVMMSSTVFAQQAQPLAKVKEVPAVADIAAPRPGDQKITIPASPSGYRLVYKGSDHLPVIDSAGRIHKPLTTTKVNLYFQLIHQTADSIVHDIAKQVTVAGQFADQGQNPQPFVVPALREWHGGSGDFIVGNATRIVLHAGQQATLKKAAEILRNDLKTQFGYNLTVTAGQPQKGDIFLTLNEADQSIGTEGYYFKVDDVLKISAVNYKGLFWGTRTLLQLLEQNKRIPAGIARDYPEFQVRGFVLDVGRKFFTLQFLQDYVKLMAYYKLNDFQIHLNDNGFKKYFDEDWAKTYSAFRLENSTYPGLTAKDGSYTKQEFIDLQKLAADHAVRIIPEIDAPAHALSIVKAVPEIGSKKYGLDHLDLHHPKTNEVVANIFKEYLSGPSPVFIGNEIHIGTDEYAKEEAEAFRAFTDFMIKHVQGFNKQVRVWGALTHAKGKTPVTVKDVTMNSWYNGYADPIAMKKLGYKQISTPDGWLYIVPAAGYYYDYLNEKNLYAKWSPLQIGNVRFPAGDPGIIGGSFAAWNDIVGNGVTEKDVHDRVFPAMQVLAQKMWGGDQTIMTYEAFDAARKQLGEGPSVNIRGKLAAHGTPLHLAYPLDQPVDGIALEKASYEKGHQGKALSFKGASSYAKLPYKEIGYDYTVSFWINPAKNKDNDVSIFKSPHSVLKLKQVNSGKLGFSRDGYDLDFDYVLPEKKWTQVVITGTAKGTSLYINGKLQKKLQDNWIQYTDKDKTKMRKVETLVFPLERVGGFNGKIDDIQIWNKVLSDQEIENL